MNGLRWAVRLFVAGVFAACLWAHVTALCGHLVGLRVELFLVNFAAVAAASWVCLPSLRRPTSLPLLLIVLVVCGVVYTNVYWFVIAAVSGHGTETGVPSGDECGRYLQNHGKVIRELSEEEYRTHLLNGDRQWTATCAVFSFLAVGVSLIPPRKGVTPPRADTPPAPSPEQVPPGG